MNRLTGMYCWKFYAASQPWLLSIVGMFAAVLLATGEAEAQAPENPPVAGAAGQAPPNAQQAANREALLERLTDEIAALTPGNLAEPETLRGEVRAAVMLLLENKAEQTQGQLDKLRELHPQLPPMQLCMAAVYFAINNNNEGIRLLEETAIAFPELPTVYTAFSRLALAQRRRTDAHALLDKARQKIDRGSWSESEKAHFEIAWLDAMADLMLLRLDYSEAQKYLDQLLARRPDDARTVMRLAEVAFQQGNREVCLERLQRFSELNPERPSPELMMATLFAANKRLLEADEWVEKARQAQPENPRVLLDYASWMLDREKFLEATQALDVFDRVSPGKAEGRLLRAKVNFANRDYAAAEKVLGELRLSDPGNADIANLWALSLIENSDADKRQRALEVAAQNAQLQPQNPVAAAILGWVLFRQDDLQQAREWLGRASQGQRLTPEMAFFLAKFFQSAGDKDKALQLVTQALEQPGLFLYRTSARELRKELIGGN